MHPDDNINVNDNDEVNQKVYESQNEKRETL